MQAIIELLTEHKKTTNIAEPRRTILSPSLRRSKRMDELNEILRLLNTTTDWPTRVKDQPLILEDEILTPRQKLIGAKCWCHT
ncbi:hypothetical protein KIN20_007486 [Parelaphostrongylus tenuis]|uniref:Uncharacterized protein n=1 Tax=Parelaphostrongylus tenuis TaxID=148309 RepID=A0AAD5QM28_PARTN|nr:hypothetical protein KIN20_007486 [Parelaphostrongylus tenuis]